MTIQRVERTGLDGTTVFVMLGRNQIPAVKASYGDKLVTTTLTEMGKQEISVRSPGSYETDPVKITFEAVTYFAQVAPLLDKDGFGNRKLPIVIGNSHPDLGDESDLLNPCRYVETARETTNENNVQVIETTWTTDQIYWTNNRKTRNQLDLSQPLGNSQF